MKPPAMGPIMGARDGVPITIQDAAARSCTRKTSPMTAETIVMTADPPTPASSRMMIKEGMFGAKLHPRMNALKNALEVLITTVRPYISDLEV